MKAKLLTRIQALEKIKETLPDGTIVIRFVSADTSVSRDCLFKEGKLITGVRIEEACRREAK